jgi:hypothetical protein
MEDLRKSKNARKEERRRVNVLAIVMGFFRWIRTRWKIILFWVGFFILVNIIFNPKNTANFINHWYDSFIGTIIDNHDE